MTGIYSRRFRKVKRQLRGDRRLDRSCGIVCLVTMRDRVGKAGKAENETKLLVGRRVSGPLRRQRRQRPVRQGLHPSPRRGARLVFRTGEAAPRVPPPSPPSAMTGAGWEPPGRDRPVLKTRRLRPPQPRAVGETPCVEALSLGASCLRRVGVGVGVGVVGGVVVGGVVVGGCVVGGCVVGDSVGAGDVVVGVGDGDVVVGVGDFVGDCVGAGGSEEVSEFDEDTVSGATTTLAGLPPTKLLTGCEVLVCATVLWLADDDEFWVGIVVLIPRFDVEGLLLEISTAMIATTPMAAAPIPANKKLRFPGFRGCGSRLGAPW